MTGWIVATATTAVLGAVGVGVAMETGGGQGWARQSGDVAIADLGPGVEQAVRIFGGTGSQIGVSIRDLNADELKTGKTAGVVIEDVEADSPAQKAGFRAADIVVEFDGERVRSMRQFMRLVQETPAGRSTQAGVTRDGQKVTLSVEPRSSGAFKFFEGSSDRLLAEPKPTPPMVWNRDMLPPSLDLLLGSSGQLGISVEELSPQLSEYFGAKEGILVKTVHENSNASRAGVKAGDVITSLNGGAVSAVADLRRRSQRLEGGDEFTLGIVRDKKPMTLKGKIDSSQSPRRSSARTIV